MRTDGLQPSGAAYVAAMAACARGGVADLALELFDRVLVEHPGDEKVRTVCCSVMVQYRIYFFAAVHCLHVAFEKDVVRVTPSLCTLSLL